MEFRLCAEFAGLPVREHRQLWCDGLDPEAYFLDEVPPRIVGRAWLMGGRLQGDWSFEFLLPASLPRPITRMTICWDDLLPSADMTCWMSFDEQRRVLEIEPAAARSDIASALPRHELEHWNNEMQRLSRRFEMWTQTPFPGGLSSASMEKADLVLIDADIAMMVKSFVENGPLRPQARTELTRLLAELCEALPWLEGTAAAYFGELADLARGAIELSRMLSGA